MVEFREDTKVWPLLTQLATCLCQELASSGLPEPCFCGVVPGEVALDFCDACEDGSCGGTAWVSANSMTPALSMGLLAPTRCSVGLIDMVFQVGVVRCAPMADDSGTPPDGAAYLAAAELQMADMAASLRAIVCCLDDQLPVIGGWTSYGPEGGCVGGVWTATLQAV
jgi:hypothetical protein